MQHRQLTHCFDYSALQHYLTEQVSLTYHGFTRDHVALLHLLQVSLPLQKFTVYLGACINIVGVDF